MEILDIHTHNLDTKPSEAIISCRPQEFLPLPGCYYSVGFHPWFLSTDGREDWNLLNCLIQHPQVLAIGEAGLDKTKGAELSVQLKVFEKQIQISMDIQKPLIIHSVHTTNEITQLKNKYKPGNPWIIHGFRGKKELARQLITHGFYLSFGENYQEEALRNMPLEKLFLETDDSEIPIYELYQKAADILCIPVRNLIKHVRQNISNVFFK